MCTRCGNWQNTTDGITRTIQPSIVDKIGPIRLDVWQDGQDWRWSVVATFRSGVSAEGQDLSCIGAMGEAETAALRLVSSAIVVHDGEGWTVKVNGQIVKAFCGGETGRAKARAFCRAAGLLPAHTAGVSADTFLRT